MIDKKFIYFVNETTFWTQYNAGNIPNDSIVFIEDVKEIWTHGECYPCPCTKEEFTALKTKVDSLNNYDDTSITNEINELRSDLDTLVSGNTTEAIESFNEIIAFLEGIEDSSDLSSVIASIEQQIAAKQDAISDLATIRSNASKGATALQSVPDEYVTETELITELSGKVDKITGKQLSTEDFTTELKNKLSGLENYDDSSLSSLVSSLDSQLNYFPADRIKAGYLNSHPENNPVIIPFVNNDIAHLLKRGGSAIVKYDDVQEWIDITNAFDGSPSYLNMNVSEVSVVTIELTLHKTFSWSNIIYVDFGYVSWKAGNITVEVMNNEFAEDTWTQKGHIENNELGNYYIKFEHIPTGGTSAGDGFNMIKFTFSNFSQYGSLRIATLGLINYGSFGTRESFVPRDGGEIYGGLYPYSSDTYDLGTNGNKWNNIYISNINGTAVSDFATKTDVTEEVVVTNGTEPTEADIWIDTSEEPESTISIKDAPADGKLYGRKNSSWQETQISFTNKTASSWVSDSTYSDYPYRCDIACSGVTANDYAEVIFDIEQATSGEYAPLCETNADIVSIWSATNTSITIPTIIITK